MRNRLGLALCLLAACKAADPHGTPGGPDAGAGVDVLPPLDGRDPRLHDAAIDAPDADPTVPDTTPPSLVEITPSANASVWLRAPIRLTFDEPLAADISRTEVSVRVGSTAVAASVALEAPSTLVITLDPAARGVGAMSLHVDVDVEDLAGNALVTPIDTSFAVPAWHRAPIDRGYAGGAPSITVDGDGRIVAAWIVGGAGSRRAAIAELTGTGWRSLGATLGTGDVTSCAIALDADAAPVVAYVDSGSVLTARWSGTAWSDLGSPGAASTVALAAPPAGSPILARFGAATVTLHTLAGGAWQALGTDLPLPAAIAGEPALAAPAAGAAVVGLVDATEQLRVFRFTGAWTALTPIAVSTGSRMSLAARGTSVAIAWDQWAGSFGVLAAAAPNGATTWTRLGKPLDVDIAGDARAPAIAYDAGGAPVVAWTELVETAQRGGVARWSGSAWTIVGGVSWLPGSTMQPSGTRLALDGSGAPVIASSAQGDIHVLRFNGPRTPALGMSARASLAGCSYDASVPAPLLSQTGCFDLSMARRPAAHAGLVPYDVVAELWSDGAKKRRWIGLPGGQSTTLSSNGSWAAPVGTILVKEFALETTPGDPATRRPVETRFLVNDGALGWQGFTYRWNAAGTDASLLDDSQLVVDWPMDDGSTHAHVYPSRAHCRSCHTATRGPVLGLRPEQLARWADYDGVIADQLATLVALDVGPSSAVPAFTAPHDPSATAELRTRGYMAANCSHCHNPEYISVKDLRYATPLAQTRLCESIVPGSPSQSVVYQRVTSRPGMPPLGTVAVDPLVTETLGTWITGMTSCP